MSEHTPVVHCKKDEFDVYVGRGQNQAHFQDTEIGTRGWLGNPHTLEDMTRSDSIMAFASDFHEVLFIEQQQEYIDAVTSLCGSTLGCWCKPKPCHGDVIAHAADLLASIQGEDQ